MTRYSVSPDAACAAVDDGTVVLNMRTKRYYSLNETGATVWRMLENDTATAQIAGELVAIYEVAEATAIETVEALLRELEAEALIAPTSA
jgi:hypothetical protein